MADDRIRVVIDGDASDLTRELQRAGGQVTAFGRQASGSSRGVAAFNAVAGQQVRNLQAIGRWSMYAAQGVGLAAGAVAAYSIKEGIQFNSTMESNRMALEQFLGSTQAADRFLKQLFETAKRGPFEFTQITKAGRQLLAFEFTKGEATKTLDAISDSVAALGGSAELIDRVVIAMGQIQAKGRVQGDELLQLAEAGIPAYQILRDELNLTADEVKRIGNAGITADQAIGALVEGMSDRFGGAAERQAKTFAGQMSILKDNYSQMMGAMTEGLFNEMKDWLPMVNETAEEIAAIWNRDDLTPERKFAESRRAAEKNLGPLVDEIGRMVDRADLPEKFGQALAAALPIAADGAGQLGVAIAKGTVEGFLASDVWGKLLIGGWLFTKMGGFAAIRAAGARAGAEAAAGAAAGASTGAGGAIGRGAGIAASAGLGIAAVYQLQQIQDAFKVFKDLSGDVWEQLDQVEGKAGTTQAQVQGLFESLSGSGFIGGSVVGAAGETIGGFLGFDELDDNADSAAKLKAVLEQVNVVGASRADQLRREGRQLLNNLNLTEEARKEAEKILNLKPAQAGDVQGGIDRLAGGLITRMGDIKKLMRENAIAAAEAFGEGTPAWRSASARNINAAVQAIRAGMRDGVIETRKGKQAIRQLLAKRDLLSGADPVGLAQGFRKSWVGAGKINQQSITRIINQLDQMPRGARNKAAQMLIQMARQMEKDRKLPEGSMSKLRSALLSNLDVTVKQGSSHIKKLQDAAGEGGRAWSRALDGYGKSTEDGMRRTTRALNRGFRDADQAMDRLTRRAGDLTAGVGGPFRRLPTPVGAGMQQVAAQVNTGLQAVGSDKSIQLAFAEGGMMRVAGQGLHDSVAVTGQDIRAMVAPGEDLVVLNRHQRPMVDAAVQNTYGVSGLSGFFNRYDRPHYMAGGGVAPGSDKIDRPKLAGTPSTAREFGSAGLDMFWKAAVKFFEKHNKVVSGSNVVEVGHNLQKLGYTISGQDAFGGRPTSGHAANSWHYKGRAIDVNDDGAPFGYGSSEMESLDWLEPQLAKLPHLELLWRTADHFDHLHFAMNRGGKIPRLYSGGQIATVKTVGEFLMKRGFNHRSAAGILGNAYREGLWNPSQMEYTGLDNGGLYGFTTSPVSLQDVRNFASRRGKAWDDPILQTNFMLSHGDPPGMALREEMNKANKIRKATEIFMSKWEKPDVPALGDRVKAAFDASKIMRDAGISGDDGQSAADQRKQEAAQRRSQRKKQIEALTRKARSASTTARKKALWWQVIEQYAKYGEFDMPSAFTTAAGGVGIRGFNEKAHLLSQAARISGIPNPNRGAGQLANLAKWLEGHVEITGRESEDRGLVSRLSAFKERGGDRAEKRRKKIYKRMARYGTEFPGGRLLDGSLDRIEATREWVKIAESRATNAGGPGGSDYTDEELNYVTRLYQSLLREQVSQRNLISSSLPKALGRKQTLLDKIEAGKKNPKLKWKIPGWRQGLSAINATIDKMRANRTTLIGVTGQGGDIFDTRQRLQELGATTTVEGARQNEINSLLKEQLTESQRGFALGQAQYGVFKDFLSGMDSPFLGAFAMGTAGRRVGRTGLAVLHENEVVTPDQRGPYGQNMSTVSSGAAPVVEITVAGDVAPLLNRIDARIDGKTAQVVQKVNSQIGREGRQLAHAPGR